MQANGGTSESTNGGGGNVGGGGNDGLSSVSDSAGANSNSVGQSVGVSGINNTQAQNQQQHLRLSTSPGQQQQQQAQVSGPDAVSNQSGSNVHHGPTPHHQRQSQYHNQQHQMQHYHHHQHNKYNNPRGDSESNINHVLLITVINPHYTITCDLMHQICSTYGKVNRIVIFKKNGVQAMVEFDSIESAKRAKSMLYGCDIYSGCCTLKIEYAKPTRLNIHKNDNNSFDYTNPNLSSGGGNPGPNEPGGHVGGSNEPSHHHNRSGRSGGSGSGASSGGGGGSGGHNQHHGSHHFRHPSHHHHHSSVPQQATGPQHSGASGGYGIDQSSPTADAFHQDGGFNSRGGGGSGSGSGGSGGANDTQQGYVGVDSYMPNPHGAHHGHSLHSNLYSRQDGHQHHHHQHHSRSGGHNHNSSFALANTTNALMSGPSNLAPPQGTVMMVYGLQPERVNCDRLFNLFCLYGNVVRVKFLRTKEGCAMVQMGDVLAVDRCVSSLNKITLFGSELQISYSKQPFLHDVIQPFILPDGSPSFKDFMGNKNNRFNNPEVASKNRILPPSQVLHFFNAPLGITEDELVHLFKQTAGHEPVSIKMFTPKTDNVKSYSGLVTFKDPAEATETLVLCNHLSMPKLGASNPYILRLCFSPPTYMRPPQPPPPPYAGPGN